MDKNEIQALIKKHSHFTSMLAELLKSLLISSEIKFHVVESRTKTDTSLVEKIKRKENENIDEITDLSGIRIILYYQDDVDKILELIKDNFIIDQKNSINKAELYTSNEFGYLSVHYIVSLNKKRNTLPEWQANSKLKAEIQVRTVLQHSWASISHELTYKKNYEIPKELQRKLFRLAGLFELADEQFLKIRDEHDLLKKSIEKISLSSEIESEKINSLTLKFSIDKKGAIYETLEKYAIEAGFSKSYRSTMDETYISDIVFISKLLGLESIKDVEQTLKSNQEKLKLFYKDLLDKSISGWSGSREFLNLLGILFYLNEKQLDEYFNNSQWSRDLFDRVIKSIKKIKNPDSTDL